MKTSMKVMLATGIFLIAAVPVHAHDGGRNDGVRERMQRQHSRIDHGMETGKLTRKEAKELKQDQYRTRHLFRDFREDGYLSKKERRRLERRLDRVSERIWELKHNKRSRYNGPDHRYSYDWHDDGGRSRHRHTHGW